MSQDYKDTVFLPKTKFSMKARLAKKEPVLAQEWYDARVYLKRQMRGSDEKTFVLHDGPPYANGHLHMGHALNKILKDVFLKYKAMMGNKTPYRPGWDCHGLPIEWMVEEQYRKAGKDKDAVSVLEFRKECRYFAEKWVKIQAAEFRRLGVIADWDNPYRTMDKSSEALIIKDLHHFLMNGGLYKGEKPVFWSVVEKTALAEAEVEYKDKTSPSIFVRFPVVDAAHASLIGAYAVVWTTTPWTLPGNQAIAYHADHSYVVLSVQDGPRSGEKFLVARDRKSAFLEKTALHCSVEETVDGKQLAGSICAHPLRDAGYALDVPFLPGDHVTLEQGTGLVHTAPAHGVDDFHLGQKFNLDIYQPVRPDGIYYEHVPVFAGDHVYTVHTKVLEMLEGVGALLHSESITHSYPHSWRSKAPLIVRTAPQWFISMEENGLRAKALEAVDTVKWVPTQAKNRIRGMVDRRPDWCVSRQRSWGVPIAVFVHKETGVPLRDERVNMRIVNAILEEGCDLWFEDNVSDRFLAPDYNPNDFEKSTDILDVWFESGCSYNYAIKAKNLPLPIDLYLEGSDQHRGWFQSTLLTSVGIQGFAAYSTVLTHGFIVDEQGYKMSKSSKNVMKLDAVLENSGADLLRLWVMGSDYMDDLKLGSDILRHQEDIYRRLRNTLRFLLGNLPTLSTVDHVSAPTMYHHGSNATGETLDLGQHAPYKDLPDLERWVLHRLSTLQKCVNRHLNRSDLHGLFKELYAFCTADLSAFYFDIRKDILYCDSRASVRYQYVLYTLKQIFDHLVRWLSPIVSFTAEEAWQILYPGPSIHLETFPPIPEHWHHDNLGKNWERIRRVRQLVTNALEQDRIEKKIGASLEAHIDLYVEDEELHNILKGLDLADVMITSSLCLSAASVPKHAAVSQDVLGVGVVTSLACGEKCARCWRILKEVGQQKYDTLCSRCVDAVDNI